MYTSRHNWILHAGGVDGLVQRRGPHRHVEYPEHGYFLLARTMIMTEAITTRKKTFLDRPEWKTIPWSKHPETKTPVHHLMDVQTAFPGIMSDYRTLSSSLFSFEEKCALCDNIVGQLEDLMRDTISWRWDFELHNPYICSEVPPDRQNSYVYKEDGVPLYSTVLSFVDLSTAYTLNFYHTVVAWQLYVAQMFGAPELWSTTYTSLLFSHSPPLPTNPLPYPSADQEMLPLVDAVARAIDYYLRPGYAQVNKLQLIWPQRTMVLGFAQANEIDKVEWALRFGKKCAAEGGPDLLQHMGRLTIPGLQGEPVEGLKGFASNKTIQRVEELNTDVHSRTSAGEKLGDETCME